MLFFFLMFATSFNLRSSGEKDPEKKKIWEMFFKKFSKGLACHRK